MIDVTALGELLIDFTCLSTDETGYPTMATHPGGISSLFSLEEIQARLSL